MTRLAIPPSCEVGQVARERTHPSGPPNREVRVSRRSISASSSGEVERSIKAAREGFLKRLSLGWEGDARGGGPVPADLWKRGSQFLLRLRFEAARRPLSCKETVSPRP